MGKDGRSLGHKVKYSWRYLTRDRGFVRSFFPNKERVYPEVDEGDVVADLHCHPFLGNGDGVKGIVESARRNGINLLGVVKHVGSDERDYWGFKAELKERELLREEDYDYVARTADDSLWIVGGYETTVTVDGLGSDVGLDMIALMPNAKFNNKGNIREGMELSKFLDLARKYKAIILAGHLCVLPRRKGIPFRSSNPNDAAWLREEIIPEIDGADEVSDAAAWMNYSWEQSYNEFGRTLRSSDAHTRIVGPFKYVPWVRGKMEVYLRNEIGRGYTVFPGLRESVASNIGDLKEELRGRIRERDYAVGGEFTPALQFVLGTALPSLIGKLKIS